MFLIRLVVVTNNEKHVDSTSGKRHLTSNQPRTPVSSGAYREANDAAVVIGEQHAKSKRRRREGGVDPGKNRGVFFNLPGQFGGHRFALDPGERLGRARMDRWWYRGRSCHARTLHSHHLATRRRISPCRNAKWLVHLHWPRHRNNQGIHSI